jgi:hypothetical protein
MNQKNPNPNYFEGVKDGDQVYLLGWGVATVIQASPSFKTFKIKVQEAGGLEQDVNYSGFVNYANHQTVFWREPKIIDLGRPTMQVDTLVMVWDGDGNTATIRHFSHFNNEGVLHAFCDGRSSSTSGGLTPKPWAEWKILSEDEIDTIRKVALIDLAHRINQ